MIRFIVIFTFVSFLFSFPYSFPHAADPRDQLQKIQKRLFEEKSKVKKTIKKEKSILADLEDITKNLRKKRKSLKDLDGRLTSTRSEIRKLDNKISLLRDKLNSQEELLKLRLRGLYKQRYGNIAEILVSAKDNQDLIKKVKYISFIAAYDRKLMQSYSDEIEAHRIVMRRMEVLKKDLAVNKKNVEKKTEELKVERKNKDKLLSSIKNKRSSYEKMIRELEDSSRNLRVMIKNLEKEKSAPPAAGKGFGKLKGRLPWPVYGNVLLPFGKQKDHQFNITTYRKGIEIKSDLGSAVLAVSGGRVVYADTFKGYGLLVIINHGKGFHSLYANLSEIFHKTGAIIKKRQAVGRVGESGVLNVPSLYFEIRHKGRPLNPTSWLRPRKKK
jgi:septal ring factor EnvC (AmiA/AmiB activator)